MISQPDSPSGGCRSENFGSGIRLASADSVRIFRSGLDPERAHPLFRICPAGSPRYPYAHSIDDFRRRYSNGSVFWERRRIDLRRFHRSSAGDPSRWSPMPRLADSAAAAEESSRCRTLRGREVPWDAHGSTWTSSTYLTATSGCTRPQDHLQRSNTEGEFGESSNRELGPQNQQGTVAGVTSITSATPPPRRRRLFHRSPLIDGRNDPERRRRCGFRPIASVFLRFWSPGSLMQHRP
jgi:hypothetical protein